jgi:hypothetical protein
MKEERVGALLPKLREHLSAEFDDEILLADGFDDCLIGIAYTWDSNGTREFVAIYSIDKIIKSMMNDGMSYEDAYEYFDFNIEGGYVGRRTPIFMHDVPRDSDLSGC